VAALVFGALYAQLPGPNGIVKALPLGGIYLLASIVAVVAAHESYDPQWSFRAFELILYLTALGVTLDWSTLRARGGEWAQLLEYYQVRDVRAVAAYASPVALSIAVVAQQLLTGDAHDAIVSIIKGFGTVLPH
jgi:hypothetical protein